MGQAEIPARNWVRRGTRLRYLLTQTQKKPHPSGCGFVLNRVSCADYLLAGFALFETGIPRSHRASNTNDFSFRQCWARGSNTTDSTTTNRI